MDRTGFAALPLSGLPASSSKKVFLIRLPKGTDLNILDGVSFDMNTGKADNIYKDEESEFNCHLDPNLSHDFVRPLISKTEGDLSIGPKLAGTITVTRKFIPDPRIEANVLELYREIEQKRGLRIRTLPFGSTSLPKDVVKANLDAQARQSLSTSTHKKRSAPEVASSPNKERSQESSEKEAKKSKKKKSEKA